MDEVEREDEPAPYSADDMARCYAMGFRAGAVAGVLALLVVGLMAAPLLMALLGRG